MKCRGWLGRMVNACLEEEEFSMNRIGGISLFGSQVRSMHQNEL